MNGYDLSRQWFDFAFENPEKINPNHAAIYFFAIEHNNRLGWREKFGFPTQMAMDAIGIKKASTYKKYFDDLVEWGFFVIIQAPKNQYSASIITLSATDSAKPKNGKPLDKAIVKHAAKQTLGTGLGTGQSKWPIDKPLTIEPINQRTEQLKEIFPFVENVLHAWQKDLDFQEVYANYVFSLHDGKWSDGQHIALMRRIKQYSKDASKSALDNCILTGFKDPKPDWFKGQNSSEWIYAKGSQECYKYQLIDGKQANTSPATLQEYLNYKNELRTA